MTTLSSPPSPGSWSALISVRSSSPCTDRHVGLTFTCGVHWWANKIASSVLIHVQCVWLMACDSLFSWLLLGENVVDTGQAKGWFYLYRSLKVWLGNFDFQPLYWDKVQMTAVTLKEVDFFTWNLLVSHSAFKPRICTKPDNIRYKNWMRYCVLCLYSIATPYLVMRDSSQSC